MREARTLPGARDRVCIYGLVDPRDSLIHYVGRTAAALQNRLKAHKYDLSPCYDGKARGAGVDKIKWLQALRALGLAPTIRVLEEVDADEAVEAEKRWVQALFRAGVPLTNRQWRPRSYVDSPDWLRGFASALARLHQLCGQASAVRDTLESLGLTLSRFKQVGVDEIELRELAKCVEVSR